MEDYNKIIESLNVKFLKAKNLQIISPIVVENHYDVENYIFLLHDSEISFVDSNKNNKEASEWRKVEVGDMLFVPGGKLSAICFGEQTKAQRINNEEYISNREKYLEQNGNAAQVGKLPNSFSYLSFEAKVFDSINFFASLDIPPFIIKDNPGLARIVKEVNQEWLSKNPGRNRVIKLKTEQIIIEIIRYIIKNGFFVEQLATNSTYFKDPRLIDIFNYIKNYLGGDLSNKVLASVANVSEDYVGQYFKMLTGINPQDYIEYQRMEAAVHLLRTTKKSIREIGYEVGYKDTAYFCRRFKMMFGIPAGKMRRRDSLVPASN
jgi:AraC-like DNA-binding protein